MTVDERARAGLFLAMQYPVEVPGVSVSNFLRTAKTAIDGEAPKLRTWVKDVDDGARANLNLDPTFAHAQRQRGLLRRREEAPRDRPARAAQPEGRGPRRDRLRPRHRRAQGRLRGRQPVPRAGGQGRPADHALHADPALHQARLRARLRRRPDRRAGRSRAGRAARGRGLRASTSRQAQRSDQVCPGSAGLLPDWRSSARTSRSSSARSRAGCRWSTSTAPTPRRSRRWSSTRWSTTSSGTTPTSPAPCTSSARSRPRRSRPRATRSRRSSTRPRATRWSSPRTPPRRSTWSRTRWPGPDRSGRPRRRGRHHRDGAPLQHRAVAAARRAHRRDAALVRPDRRRPARPVEHRRAHHRAHQGRLA